MIWGAPGTCRIELRLEREHRFHLFTQSREDHRKSSTKTLIFETLGTPKSQKIQKKTSRKTHKKWDTQTPPWAGLQGRVYPHGGSRFPNVCPGPVPQLYIYIYIYIHVVPPWGDRSEGFLQRYIYIYIYIYIYYILFKNILRLIYMTICIHMFR